jgi:CTP synthase
VQYHPEFKSRPNHPHPLFTAFVGKALDVQRLATAKVM